MTNKYLKLFVNDNSKWIQKTYPKSFLLLLYLANKTSEMEEEDSYKEGGTIVNSSSAHGLTRGEYRRAFKKLCDFKFIEVKDQKPWGTIVKLNENPFFEICESEISF